MASSTSTIQIEHHDAETPLEQIVFSCCICQSTPSEIYKKTENNKGFHSGSCEDGGIVIKMWIGSCSHIVCAAHFNGGAVPFHPTGAQPRETCPKCSELGDNDAKDLFAIRGVARGELDPAIPEEWLRCPPLRLDSNAPDMQGLRFQYAAMALHAQKARSRWRRAERDYDAAERACGKLRAQLYQSQYRTSELEERMSELQSLETRLQKWEQRRSHINYYLGLVARMAGEIAELRSTLIHLGCEPPQFNYALDLEQAPTPAASEFPTNELDPPACPTSQREPAIGSLHNTVRKRRHSGHSADGQILNDGRSSRETMPPPRREKSEILSFNSDPSISTLQQIHEPRHATDKAHMSIPEAAQIHRRPETTKISDYFTIHRKLIRIPSARSTTPDLILQARSQKDFDRLNCHHGGHAGQITNRALPDNHHHQNRRHGVSVHNVPNQIYISQAARLSLANEALPKAMQTDDCRRSMNPSFESSVRSSHFISGSRIATPNATFRRCSDSQESLLPKIYESNPLRHQKTTFVKLRGMSSRRQVIPNRRGRLNCDAHTNLSPDFDIRRMPSTPSIAPRFPASHPINDECATGTSSEYAINAYERHDVRYRSSQIHDKSSPHRHWYSPISSNDQSMTS